MLNLIYDDLTKKPDFRSCLIWVQHHETDPDGRFSDFVQFLEAIHFANDASHSADPSETFPGSTLKCEKK